MSTIVKGQIGNISEIRELRSGDPVVTVTVYDNHRRHVEGGWVDDGTTRYEIGFTRGLAQRIVDSFRTGDAVLIEADQLRTNTYTTKDQKVAAVIRAWGIDIGLSPRYKAFAGT